MTPNWQMTASKLPSAKGSAVASAWRHMMPPAGSWAAAWSSIAWLRSLATIIARCGKALRKARVTMPVPQAVSSTAEGVRRAARRARSAA
jgi:hypothetical protein